MFSYFPFVFATVMLRLLTQRPAMKGWSDYKTSLWSSLNKEGALQSPEKLYTKARKVWLFFLITASKDM